MIVGMLPTTAFAAAYNSVGVNNVVLKDGYYLETNGATEAKVRIPRLQLMSHGIRMAF